MEYAGLNSINSTLNNLNNATDNLNNTINNLNRNADDSNNNFFDDNWIFMLIIFLAYWQTVQFYSNYLMNMNNLLLNSYTSLTNDIFDNCCAKKSSKDSNKNNCNCNCCCNCCW